jgi:hypothetical protein
LYQPVSEVDVCCTILRGGVLFKEVADFEVEVWKVCCASKPVVVGIYIGENYDLATVEDC